MKLIMICLLLISLSLSVSSAKAVEALTSQELASHCSHYDKDPKGIDAVFCVRYIQGFIDGAVATDERVVSNIVTGKEEETFSERAMRTRLGKLRLYGSTYYADFCLNDPIKLNEAVEKVVADLMNNTIVDNAKLARDVVYQSFLNNYPCKKK